MALLDTLRAFSRKQATTDEVLRAVLEHDRWQMPAEHFARGRDPAVAPRVVIYDTQSSIPAGALWLFSDDERARRAADLGRLGACAADLPGTEALARLDGVTRVDVNPGSPVEETFFMELDDPTRSFVSLWAAAVKLEQAVARGPLDDPWVLGALRSFPAYGVYFNPDGSVVTLPGQLGLANGAVAFTTPDNAQRFVDRVPAEKMQTLRRAFASGAKLFPFVAEGGVDGVLLDPFGPAEPVALPLEVCKKVAELVKETS